MATEDTDQQQPSPEVDRLAVETFRTIILGSLNELAGLLDITAEMVHARTQGMGFLTAEGRRVLDELTRQERKDRVEHAKQGIKLPGASAAPGNLKAWAANAEIHVGLAGIHHGLMSRLHEAGICLTWRTPTDPDPVLLMARIGVLVSHTTSTRMLEKVDRELQRLVEQAKVLVDGRGMHRHPDPCPHCGLHTLVIYFTDRVIRCEQDPHTGQFEPCLCKDKFCLCRLKGQRHEWYADELVAKAKRARTWWNLTDDLNRARRAAQEKKTHGRNH